ncbi:hypothetical protein M569_10587 [Genlisea aurea]|uniref:PPC domain-containing protein n=1 Tax=Genlisea aurea TaxID=192259 RepID=S8CBF8_9LAMI|nr:hypothetical protein M569_10587 [Genlisea aurea]
MAWQNAFNYYFASRMEEQSKKTLTPIPPPPPTISVGESSNSSSSGNDNNNCQPCFAGQCLFKTVVIGISEGSDILAVISSYREILNQKSLLLINSYVGFMKKATIMHQNQGRELNGLYQVISMNGFFATSHSFYLACALISPTGQFVMGPVVGKCIAHGPSFVTATIW